MLVTLLVVFVGAFGLVLGTYVFLSRKRLTRQAAARRRIKEAQVLGTGLTLLRDESASSIPVLNQWLQKSAHTVSLQRSIKQAGLHVKPATIILAAITLAILGLLVGSLQRGTLVGMAYGGLGLFYALMVQGMKGNIGGVVGKARGYYDALTGNRERALRILHAARPRK